VLGSIAATDLRNAIGERVFREQLEKALLLPVPADVVDITINVDPALAGPACGSVA
jgi:hypothetical protein